MSKSPVWIVAAVALLAALAVVWSQLDDGAPPVPVAQQPEQVAETDSPTAAASLTGDATGEPDSDPAAPVREEVTTQAPQSQSDHTGPLLRVVDAGSRSPVPGANVYFLSLDPGRTTALAAQLRPRVEDARGRRTQTQQPQGLAAAGMSQVVLGFDVELRRCLGGMLR